MDSNAQARFKNVAFTEEQCALFTEIVEQDDLNIKVLFFIAQCEQNKKKVHAKEISENIKIPRPVGSKNHQGDVKSFNITEDYIDRKRAEKIVDRLAYASLIYFEVQKPYKYIRLTERGVQVAINIQKRMN